jgi:hypothetical protein
LSWISRKNQFYRFVSTFELIKPKYPEFWVAFLGKTQFYRFVSTSEQTKPKYLEFWVEFLGKTNFIDLSKVLNKSNQSIQNFEFNFSEKPILSNYYWFWTNQTEVFRILSSISRKNQFYRFIQSFELIKPKYANLWLTFGLISSKLRINR